MRSVTFSAILCVTFAMGCTSTKGTSKKSRSSRGHISAEQIQSSSATDAYDLIQKLRPHWLRGRGSKSFRDEDAGHPVVYVDGNRHGDLDSLPAFSVEDIKEINFFSSSEATFRFGTGHTGGVIMIISR